MAIGGWDLLFLPCQFSHVAHPYSVGPAVIYQAASQQRGEREGAASNRKAEFLAVTGQDVQSRLID